MKAFLLYNSWIFLSVKATPNSTITHRPCKKSDEECSCESWAGSLLEGISDIWGQKKLIVTQKNNNKQTNNRTTRKKQRGQIVLTAVTNDGVGGKPTVSAKLWLLIKTKPCKGLDSEYISKIFVKTAFAGVITTCTMSIHFVGFVLLLVFNFMCTWHLMLFYCLLLGITNILYITWILWSYCKGELFVKYFLQTSSFGCIFMFSSFLCLLYWYILDRNVKVEVHFFSKHVMYLIGCNCIYRVTF